MLDKYQNNELVSVIIPVFNAEQYIKDTLDSVVNQKYEDIEVVIVDDCSTDDSEKIIREYTDKYPFIYYEKLKYNSGVAIARNRGVELARGRYIAYIDSDDIWLDDKLTTQIALFKKYKGIPFTYTAVCYIDESGNEIMGKRSVKEKVSYSYLLRNTMIATSTVIIDRNVVSEISMPNRRSAEDYSLWLSLLKEYGDAYGINEVYTKYRKSSNSISSNHIKEVKYFVSVQRKDMNLPVFMICFNTVCYIINAVKKHYFK